MGVEIEVKVRVEGHEPVREKLRELGGVGGGLTHEVNVFFDTPDGRLRALRRGLRIRTNRDPDGVTVVLTCKGPADAEVQGVKQREEIEVTLPADGGAEAMTAVLGRLGYFPTLSFEKRRETWRLGAAEVVLDVLPKLGSFVEVEAGDAGEVREVLERLGLGSADVVTDSYIVMMSRLAQTLGGVRHIGFDGTT